MEKGIEIKKKTPLKKKTKQRIFIILMLAYPVLQFILFFGYVNFDTILLTFQKFSWSEGKYIYSGFDNYGMFFDRVINDPWTRRTIINSLFYMPVNSLIILPLSMAFSYFLFKKVPLSGFFRVVYFLPSILPIVVMTMAFSFTFDSNLGPVNDIYKWFFGMFDSNVIVPSWFGSYPTNQIMIFVYGIWVGLGFNIILMTAAIARIPDELMEYGQLEGIGFFREFRTIVVPLIWPTVVTTFVLGMTSVFTALLQPLFLTPTSPDTNTIALAIYNSVLQNENIAYMATFGLILSLIGLPIILLTRNTLSKFYAEVDY